MKKAVTKEERRRAAAENRNFGFRPIRQSGFGTGPIVIASLIGIAAIICLVLTWPK